MIVPGGSVSFSRGLLGLAALGILDGALRLIYWVATGDPASYFGFFSREGALLLILYPLTEACCAALIRRWFAPGQHMFAAWRWIALSASCAFLGAIFAQWLGVASPLNPLVLTGNWSNMAGDTLRNIGGVLGGPCQFIILALGLSKALDTYRVTGFDPRLSWLERILLAAAGVYILNEGWRLALALWHGKHPGFFEILNWPTDPMLWVLLWQAMLLRRAVLQTGIGLIGKCWVAFAVGIGLTVAGDAGIGAVNYGVLAWPWNSVTWLLWIPASAAFALGPAYQLEAISSAQQKCVFQACGAIRPV